MSNRKISWKQHHLTLEVNGLVVKAVIFYWSKDYYIEITEPMELKLPGSHMMYMIPAYFVIEERSDSDVRAGLSPVPILKRCITAIKKAIHEYEKDSD
jgi:hypothetical protein